MKWGVMLLLAGLAIVAIACDDGSTDGGYTFFPGVPAGSGGGTSPPIDFEGGAGNLPDEVEPVSNFVAPVATGKFLWTANPLSGRVALIDVETLAIEIFPAGLAPTYLARIPTKDDSPSAIVQNVGSANASWFRRSGGKMLETKIPTQIRVNRITVSDSGRYCLFWAVPEAGKVIDASEGLQDLTIADLSASPPVVTRLTVGYRPRDVRIAPDEDRVVVVGDSDLTLLDLGDAPATSGYLPLGEGAGRDVSFDAPLAHALVRRSGEKEVEILDLDDSTRNSAIDFGEVVTDLDLMPSGLGIAVLREAHGVAVFDLAEILVDPSAFEVKTIAGEFFGSAALSPTENRAVLYTTTAATTKVVVLDLEKGAGWLEAESFDTAEPTYDVRVSPDGKHALVLSGSAETGVGSGFSVIALTEARFPRIVGTVGPIVDAAISAEAALVVARKGDESETSIVGFPALGLEQIPLASAPLRAGFLTTKNAAFVAQTYAEGRMTFYGLDELDAGTVDVSTVTGFELAADVVTR